MAEENSNSPGSYGSGCDENVVPQSKQPKICLVCGDKAKSYHFGGLCCESCKAFFRRSMQNDSFKSFFCVNGQSCVVRKDNRRACQYCRVQKCFSIGMEKGWLRTDEEILKMKEQKLAASNTKPQEVPMVVDDEPVAAIAAPLVQKEPAAEPQPAYQPKLEDISFYLSQEDVRIIENIVECYWKAYKQIPFGAEVTQNSTPRTGLQVISMFTTGIRRWAAFARSMREFSSLRRQDQSSLLQAAVMQLSILRAVASFQMSDKEWRINTPVAEFTPSLSLQDVQRLLSPQLAEMHLTFISAMHKIGVDEGILMMLSIIVLFTAEQPDLIDRDSIAATQDNYIMLLKRYCDWKYGPDDKGKTFANLLSKLSDLRELSDVHSDHQVRFANQELSKLYQEIECVQLPSLSVNMDLNNTSHFLSAMEFSISKTHQTLPDTNVATDPAFKSLEQIEEMCNTIEDDSNQEVPNDPENANSSSTTNLNG